MIRIFQIVILSGLALAITGCNGAKTKDEPLWQQMKITDIAAPGSDEEAGIQLLKSINFNIWVFEIPAENIGILNGAWQKLHTKPLQFNDYDAFIANSFSVGFGQVQMPAPASPARTRVTAGASDARRGGGWDEVAELLRAADGENAERISLLLFDGQAQTIAIAGLDNEQTMFHTSRQGSMEGATVGPGELGMRIKAEKIPGWRGVCKVEVVPVFSSLAESAILRLANRAKSGDFVFTSIGFGLKMSPGDFVFLWPDKYKSHQITLDSLFFSAPPLTAGGGRPEPIPIVRAYLIVCTSIAD